MPFQLPKLRFSPLLFIVIAIVLVLAASLFVSSKQIASLKDQLAQKQQEATNLANQNTDLQRQITSFESDRRTLESKLSELRNQLLAASAELTKARGSVSDMQNNYELLDSEKRSLENRIGDLIQERDKARADIQKLVSEKSELERSGQRLQQKIAFLQRDFDKLSEQMKQQEEAKKTVMLPPVSVLGRSEEPALNDMQPPVSSSRAIELPPIVVKKDRTASALPVRAQVIEVNSSERFVVIDKGSNDGVVNGMHFDIMRGSSKIAQVIVARVRPSISACDIVSSQSSQVLRSGDTALSRNQ
jgi:predicted nuclease with TOPRIM domain